jgi:flagellar basal body-associated protein FliL
MAKKKKKGEEPEESGGKKLDIKKIAIGAVVAVVVYTQFLSGGGGDAEAAGPTTVAEPVEGIVLDAGQVRVSLADSDPRFALVSMAVVLEEGADQLAVENRLPILLDAAVDEVSSFTADQLKGERGPELLRTSLTERAGEIFNTEGEQVQVMRVVLTEMIVQ